MVAFSSLETKLRTLLASANFQDVENNVTANAKDIQAATSTTLGDEEVGEIVSGLKALTKGKANKGVAKLTENVPEVGSQLIKDVSSVATDLNAMTGTTATNGFLSHVVLSPTVKSVQQVLEAKTTATIPQLQEILQDVVADEYVTNLNSTLKKTLDEISDDIRATANRYSKAVNNLLGNTSGGLITDLLLNADTNIIGPLLDQGLTAGQAREVYNLVVNKQIDEAAKRMVSLAGLTLNQAETFILALNTSPASLLTGGTLFDVSQPKYDTNSNTNQWNGSKTSDAIFTTVGSVEELTVEWTRVPREITEIIFFGYQQTDDQVLTASEIHSLENQTGDDGITMHYVINSSGVVQRGRPISQVSNSIEGHQLFSISVGVAYPASSSINEVQADTIDKVIDVFYQRWPGGQMFAAYDIDAEYPTPGFAVSDMLEAKGKRNYGVTTRSFSSTQLIESAKAAIR